MNEFALIARFFAEQVRHHRADVVLGIGDDCAILDVAQGQQLLLTTDTLVSGVHFPESTAPYDIAYKALAVNLSDLAAMGATPCWITLALTLPAVDESWLAAFSQGLFTLANEFNVELIGGDTTRGPLAITIQAHGLVPKGQAIRRSGARPGDWIYVTHHLGDAGCALQHLLGQRIIKTSLLAPMLRQLNQPDPRIKEGLLLRGWASAMIDISDGLVADLGHILHHSAVGALLQVDDLPLSTELRQAVSLSDALHHALCSGDDYELCFTIPAHKKTAFDAFSTEQGCSMSCIGRITEEQQLLFTGTHSSLLAASLQGYTHF